MKFSRMCQRDVNSKREKCQLTLYIKNIIWENIQEAGGARVKLNLVIKLK